MEVENQKKRLLGCKVVAYYIKVFRVGRILVQTQLGVQPSLGTQLYYEPPGDLQVKQVSIHSD